MPKWYTISGRFTEDEKTLIEKWQKRAGRSDNQMVRDGVAMMIAMWGMSDLFFRSDFAPLEGFFKEMSKVSPHSQKSMEKAFEKWTLIFKQIQMKELDAKLKEVEKELKVFDSHKKRGRQPKKQKSSKP